MSDRVGDFPCHWQGDQASIYKIQHTRRPRQLYALSGQEEPMHWFDMCNVVYTSTVAENIFIWGGARTCMFSIIIFAFSSDCRITIKFPVHSSHRYSKMSALYETVTYQLVRSRRIGSPKVNLHYVNDSHTSVYQLIVIHIAIRNKCSWRLCFSVWLSIGQHFDIPDRSGPHLVRMDIFLVCVRNTDGVFSTKVNCCKSFVSKQVLRSTRSLQIYITGTHP